MSYIPDCRNGDGAYNEKNLNELNKRAIDGYDFAIEQVVDLLFNGNEDFFNDDIIEDFFAKKLNYEVDDYETTNAFEPENTEKRSVKTYRDYILYKIWELAEMCRDELITSMLEGQDDFDEMTDETE